jgi:hypothetical protein
VTNLKPWIERIRADWSATMKLKFQAEGAHEGDAWQPLSEKHARWKARQFAGKGILERTGTLRGQAAAKQSDIRIWGHGDRQRAVPGSRPPSSR